MAKIKKQKDLKKKANWNISIDKEISIKGKAKASLLGLSPAEYVERLIDVNTNSIDLGDKNE